MSQLYKKYFKYYARVLIYQYNVPRYCRAFLKIKNIQSKHGLFTTFGSIHFKHKVHKALIN